MKMYVYTVVESLTDNYHGGGGMIVIAENDISRDKLIEKDSLIKLTLKEKTDVIIYELKGTYTENIIKFPDAGCC